MQTYDSSEIVNIGTGEGVSIKSLAEKIKKVTGFDGEITWDTTKPNGAPKKFLDVSKLHSLGWKHSVVLDDGLEKTYEWFLNNFKS